jgi:hypothetical protein
MARLKRPKVVGWWEGYKCGCVSDTVRLRRDLPGYCPTHGSDRRQIDKEVEWPEGAQP